MNELIKINTEGTDKPTVSGRELHEALGIETPYHKWFPRMCEYGFSEGEDYLTTDKNVHRADGAVMPQTQHDHEITIPMAKEICMLQRNEKGKQFRQYFIKVEEVWNSPEMVMKRALEYANESMKRLQIKVSSLTVDNQIMQPKAEYFDELVDRNLLTNFTDTAKELHVQRKILINFLIEKKYIYRDKKGNLKPYADKNNGLFELKESSNRNTEWSGTQTLVTPKGRETFRLLFLN